MKKTMIKMLVLAAASALFAGTAWGAPCNGSWQGGAGVTITDAGGGGTISVTLSPNVKVYYVANVAGTGASYSAASYNTKGTKTYGVANDYQGIMYRDDAATIAAGSAPAAPTAPSAAGITTGWNEVGK